MFKLSITRQIFELKDGMYAFAVPHSFRGDDELFSDSDGLGHWIFFEESETGFALRAVIKFAIGLGYYG